MHSKVSSSPTGRHKNAKLISGSRRLHEGPDCSGVCHTTNEPRLACPASSAPSDLNDLTASFVILTGLEPNYGRPKALSALFSHFCFTAMPAVLNANKLLHLGSSMSLGIQMTSLAAAPESCLRTWMQSFFDCHVHLLAMPLWQAQMLLRFSLDLEQQLGLAPVDQQIPLLRSRILC